MTEQSDSKVLINIHGLLGESEGTQITVESGILHETKQFIYDHVAYEIVRVILTDVEHPIVYVVLLDVLPSN